MTAINRGVLDTFDPEAKVSLRRKKSNGKSQSAKRAAGKKEIIIQG